MTPYPGHVWVANRQCTSEKLCRRRWAVHLLHCISHSTLEIVADGELLIGSDLNEQTGKAIQKTEMPVIPIDNANGRLSKNQFMTASLELIKPKLYPRPATPNPTHNCQISVDKAAMMKPTNVWTLVTEIVTKLLTSRPPSTPSVRLPHIRKILLLTTPPSRNRLGKKVTAREICWFVAL